jgi:hypothetical protein
MPTVTVGLAALAFGGFRGGINRLGPKTSTGVVASPSLGRLRGNMLFNRRVCIMVVGASHHTAWSNLLGYLVE